MLVTRTVAKAFELDPIAILIVDSPLQRCVVSRLHSLPDGLPAVSLGVAFPLPEADRHHPFLLRDPFPPSVVISFRHRSRTETRGCWTCCGRVSSAKRRFGRRSTDRTDCCSTLSCSRREVAQCSSTSRTRWTTRSCGRSFGRCGRAPMILDGRYLGWFRR